jgi:hypothetical protein
MVTSRVDSFVAFNAYLNASDLQAVFHWVCELVHLDRQSGKEGACVATVTALAASRADGQYSA